MLISYPHSLFAERWEELGSHHWDGLLVGHGESVVEGLGADDAVLLGVHHEATQARVGWVLLVVFWEELLLVHSHIAWDVVLAFEGLDLAEHELLVLLDSLVNDSLEEVLVTLAASENNLWLDQLDESLNKQLLQQSGVLVLVSLESVVHGHTSLLLQRLDQLVDGLHASNALLVLLRTLLNLKVDFCDAEVLLELVQQTLLLSMDELLLLHSEVNLSLVLDLEHTLVSVLSNELNHALHDLL